MNKKQRSISFNSVSPFRKKSPPLKRVPLSFGFNVEIQKKMDYLQFYNQSRQLNKSNAYIGNQIRNQSAGQHKLNEDRDLLSRMSNAVEMSQNNLKTNITNNDTYSRNANSKLSNYSTANSKPAIPSYSRLIKSRASAIDSFACAQNTSFISKQQNGHLSRNKDVIDIQRNNSQEHSFRVYEKQNSQTLAHQIVNSSQIGLTGGVGMNLPPKPTMRVQPISIISQDKNSNQTAQEQETFNPIHFSFYHNYNINPTNKKKQDKEYNNIQVGIQENNTKNASANNRFSFLERDQLQSKSIQMIENQGTQKRASSQQPTIQDKSQKSTIQQDDRNNGKKQIQKRYKKLQDPDRILKYIENKEIGFDTTADILTALNIAQKNTDEQLINKRRQPLAPLPNRCEEKQIYKNTNVKHIQKFDLAFNQIDEQELQNYIQEKDHFLNQIEVSRYNERYSINRENNNNTSQKKKSRDKMYNHLEKEEDSLDQTQISLSQLDLVKSDSPMLSRIKKRSSPRIAISTKQSSYDQKYGAIQPIKKYYKDFDEYSVEQKNLMRTQEQSPMNNGFSGKIEKMKKQSDQLSKITNLLHQIQRDDPIF